MSRVIYSLYIDVPESELDFFDEKDNKKINYQLISIQKMN